MSAVRVPPASSDSPNVWAGVPVVAIGGITPATAATVVAGGADWLAVIGAVFEAADPAAAVQAFLRQMAAMD